MANSLEKPRKIGLYIFGLGEIFVGLLFVLMSLLTFALPKFPSPNPQVPMPSVWPIALVELTFAALIIAFGVGTFMAKRWARKLMLILSWYWLGAGLFGVLFFAFFMGPIFDTAFSSAPQTTPALMSGIKIAMMVIMGFFYVILPGIFVLFYRSKHVLAAVEYYDPQENWMDACPTPVFAVSFFSALGALGMGVFSLMMVGTNLSAIYTAVFPAWAIVLFLVVMFTALTYISIGSYHVDIKAWWAALILVILCGAGTYFCFKLIDPLSAYQQMNVPVAQIDLMKKSGMLDMVKSLSNLGWLMMTPYLAYLFFARKYYLKGKPK